MTRLILGIDPGTTESGICVIERGQFDQVKIQVADKISNDECFKMLFEAEAVGTDHMEIVIEGMGFQARAFGKDSIITCYNIGRMLQICDQINNPAAIYTRHQYGRHFVSTGGINDGSLRAALEEIYGPSKKKGDPLFQLRGASDKRSAFAIAKYHEFKLAKVEAMSD